MLDINQACAAFQKLLEDQQQRIANMSTEKTDFSAKKVVTIGILLDISPVHLEILQHFSLFSLLCPKI